ncbi:DNA topoisomerase 1 [Linum perenne]
MTTRLQRSFLSLSSTSSSFFPSPSPSPSSSSSPLLVFRFNSLMSKCGPLQNVSSFGLIPSHRSRTRKTFTQLRVKASRFSSATGLTDASKSVYPRSVIIPLTTSCYWDFNGRIGLTAHCYGATPVRHFSQPPESNSTQDLSGKSSKVTKTRAAKQKKSSANSRVLTANGVDSLNLSDGINGNVTLEPSVSTFSCTDSTDANQTAKVIGKEKQSSIKKSKRRPSAAAAAALEDVAVVDSAKNKSEKKSTEKTSEKLLDVSAPKKPKAKRGSGNSRRKSRAANEPIEKQKPQDMSNLKPPRQGSLKQLYPPTGKTVMVVESVTKAKVIQGYLGSMFEVLPSYGHVRDLAARSGSVRPDEDFSMVWEVPSAAWTYLKSIKVALSGAENLILASDPDREGEAIAWHIIEMLQQQDALHEGINVARVVFHEITEGSIKSALQAPRHIDVNLVHAYLARRALDYLIGFNISPLLWRKLPGCQSAGRVQSAALALICDREMEIDDFKPQEYWTIEAKLNKKEPGSSSLNARLTCFDSKKLSQFSFSSGKEVEDVEHKIKATTFEVVGSKNGQMRRNPPSPYITSTLQQDAANKLQFSTSYTMKLAQKLYEGVELSKGKARGLITYTRTDGLHISDDALKDIRGLVTERYGPDFASGSVRKYFKKVKNAQEAHEAIRPTDIKIFPSMLAGILDEDALKLYTLIWSRTLACQMEPAIIEQLQVEIGNASKSILFRSTCSRVGFLGYQAVYQDVETKALRGKEDEEDTYKEVFGILNSLKAGYPVHIAAVESKQHFTQPPPRYSEASLIKKLEELGIGRPSTYASTLKVLQDRKYVIVKSRVMYPEFRGRMVSAFLSNYFTEVTDYSFTADMETELDNVCAGLTEWKGLLRDYWTRFSSYCSGTENVHIHQVEKMLEKKFGDLLFGSLRSDTRTCPSCMEGMLIFKVSRYGAGYFIGCDQHPTCKYIAKTLLADEEEEEAPQSNHVVEEPKVLGLHPVSKEKILMKKGPYGFYVQLGEDRKDYIPKRTSLAHVKDVDAVTLEESLKLLRYPMTLGNHPKDGHPILLKLAKNGYSVRYRRTIASVPKNVDPDDITVEKALEYLSSKDVRRSGRPKGPPKVDVAAVEAAL